MFRVKWNSIVLMSLLFLGAMLYPQRSSAHSSPQRILSSDPNTGPTIEILKWKQTTAKCPLSDVTYFIPLITTAQVKLTTNPGNRQQCEIIEYTKKGNTEFDFSFTLEVSDEGFHEYRFDGEQVINEYLRGLAPEKKPGNKIENLIEFIKLKGIAYNCLRLFLKVFRGIPYFNQFISCYSVYSRIGNVK